MTVQSECPNSSPTDSTVTAFWPLDGNTNDLTNRNNGTLIGSSSFVDGYIDQAINCSSTNYIEVSYIDLYRRSLTVELWFYLTNNNDYMGLFGEYENTTFENCLHYGIQEHSLLYMAFYDDDSESSTIIVENQWYHVAFVYDYDVRERQIYLNGLLEGSTLVQPNTSVIYLGQSGSVTICGSEYWQNNWSGYIDQVSITYRAKAANEILDDASLIAYYSFDCGSIFDSGPNLLRSTASGITMITGQVKGAVFFNSIGAYFQTSPFMMFGIANQSFSIALWIKPLNLSGILIHLSNQSTGNGLCMPLLGFNSSGSLIAQFSSFIVAESILSVNVWTHVVQIFSITNGLQLYINGILRQTDLATITSPPYQSMYVTVANQQPGVSSCTWGAIDPDPYAGAIDELRTYNRELTIAEICRLSS